MGTLFSLSKSTTLVCLDASEWSLLIFGALLVAGLIIEYRAEHGSRLMKFGELLVIIGVAGELLGDGGIFLFSRHLQSIADVEIAVLTKTSGDAILKAGTADKEASAANERAAINEREAAQLRKDAEDEKSARLADAQKLESEKVKRLELAASLLPRSLNDQSGMLDKMKSSHPMFVVFEYLDEPEPKMVARQLAFVFMVMGWQFGRIHVEDFRIRDGIHISAGEKRDLDRIHQNKSTLGILAEQQDWINQQQQLEVAQTTAQALKELLVSNGIDASVGHDAFDFPPSVLLIKVGEKPNHALESAIKELGGVRPATDIPSTSFGFFRIGGTLSGSATDIPDIVETPNVRQK